MIVSYMPNHRPAMYIVLTTCWPVYPGRNSSPISISMLIVEAQTTSWPLTQPQPQAGLNRWVEGMSDLSDLKGINRGLSEGDSHSLFTHSITKPKLRHHSNKRHFKILTMKVRIVKVSL